MAQEAEREKAEKRFRIKYLCSDPARSYQNVASIIADKLYILVHYYTQGYLCTRFRAENTVSRLDSTR